MRRQAFVYGLVLLLLAGAAYVVLRDTAGGAGAGPGGGAAAEVKTAPDITATDVATGKPVKLSDYRGKVVLLNFWATWCPPCRVEMPHLEKFSKEYAGRVQVLALGADPTETADQMKKFAAEFKLTLPILIDPTGVAARTYQVKAIPRTVFIDAQGRIRSIHDGAMTYEAMKEAADKILK